MEKWELVGKCPSCGMEADAEAKSRFCIHCGMDLAIASPTKRCPKCGKEVSGDASECVECKRHRRLRAATIALSALAAVAVLAIAFFVVRSTLMPASNVKYEVTCYDAESGEIISSAENEGSDGSSVTVSAPVIEGYRVAYSKHDGVTREGAAADRVVVTLNSKNDSKTLVAFYYDGVDADPGETFDFVISAVDLQTSEKVLDDSKSSAAIGEEVVVDIPVLSGYDFDHASLTVGGKAAQVKQDANRLLFTVDESVDGPVVLVVYYRESLTRADKKSPDYVLPDSDIRAYAPEELRELTDEELFIARNEIYARYGYVFKSKFLNEYFGEKDWYKPASAAEAELTKIEERNIATIRNSEKERESPFLDDKYVAKLSVSTFSLDSSAS